MQQCSNLYGTHFGQAFHSLNVHLQLCKRVKCCSGVEGHNREDLQ